MSDTQQTTNPRRIRVTLVRSTIGRPDTQERTLRSMGLRKMHQTVELPDNPSSRGMVTKVQHLVRVEVVE
jgi:large subunit ribosomal protein L30